METYESSGSPQGQGNIDLVRCSECGHEYFESFNECPKCGRFNPRKYHYAGFWLRFAAHVIDNIIMTLVYFVAMIVFLGAQQDDSTVTAIFAIISMAGGWLYYAVLESSDMQATIGKKLIGLKVTDLKGNRVSFGKASVRYWAKILSIATLYIGFAMAGWTEKKQALHDMVAGCLVVRK